MLSSSSANESLIDPEENICSVETAITALKSGRMVIVVDAEERENEGDFICAAESITPEMVDFMLRRGGGVMCAPIEQETAERLQLHEVVEAQKNSAPHRTHFLTPIDHVEAGTGVSAWNRTRTIHALANPEARVEDFVQPGHLWPLQAKKGGVLRRAGHTEATIDLLKLAGLKPMGVLIEILSEHSHDMADFQELQEISKCHEIPIVSIAALIHYRRIREQLVQREVELELPTAEYGKPKVIVYRVEHEDQEPMAIVWGDVTQTEKAPLVRMHSSCFTGDLLNSLRCDCGDQLQMAMRMIHEEGVGAVVYLPQEGRGIGLKAKLKAYQLQDQGYDTVEANHLLGFKADMRDYMVGLQILKDIGLHEVRLLTNNPKKADAFPYAGMDLKVLEQVPIIAPPVKEREHYLATKRDKMGHRLPPSLGISAEENAAETESGS